VNGIHFIIKDHSFIIYFAEAVDGSEWSASRPGRFIPIRKVRDSNANRQDMTSLCIASA
jgi:hypothetical protein